ncbi:MAG: hypothetical protein V1701_02890 [Planctomycetota bacterium]
MPENEKESPSFQKNEDGLRNIYCRECGHFLGEEKIKEGVLKVKCRWCKTWNTYTYESKSSAMNS